MYTVLFLILCVVMAVHYQSLEAKQVDYSLCKNQVLTNYSLNQSLPNNATILIEVGADTTVTMPKKDLLEVDVELSIKIIATMSLITTSLLPIHTV